MTVKSWEKTGISVIIPTLNEEKYLPKLLDCLCKQTYKNFEVIVVDGNSTDMTVEVAKKFSKKLNIKVIKVKKANVSLQRNTGARFAKNELLIFLDADNIVEKAFVSKIIRERNLHLGSPRLFVSGNYYQRFFFLNIRFFMRLFSWFKPFGIGICIISSRKIHNKIKGFDEKIRFCEDLDYVRRASNFGKFKVVDTKVFTCARRFEKFGTRKTIKLWMKGYFYHLFTSKTIEVSYKKLNG